MQLDVTIDEDEAKSLLRIHLDGGLNSDSAPSLEALLQERTEDERWRLVLLDMAGLEYISSAGLRVVFRAAKELKSTGRSLAVTNRQPQIEKVCEILRALPDMRVFSGEKELDAYLDTMQARVREEQG